MKPYDEDEVLTSYVVDHYHGLMTREEQLAARAHDFRVKATGYGDSSVSRRLLSHAQMYANAPGVGDLVAMTRDEFRRYVRDRLLRDNANDIQVNRCPQCLRIARSPLAKQCPWCFHRWHEERPE